MENLLLLLPLIACPLGMLLIGAVGWAWAKLHGEKNEQSTPSSERDRTPAAAGPSRAEQ